MASYPCALAGVLVVMLSCSVSVNVPEPAETFCEGLVTVKSMVAQADCASNPITLRIASIVAFFMFISRGFLVRALSIKFCGFSYACSAFVPLFGIIGTNLKLLASIFLIFFWAFKLATGRVRSGVEAAACSRKVFGVLSRKKTRHCIPGVACEDTRLYTKSARAVVDGPS